MRKKDERLREEEIKRITSSDHKLIKVIKELGKRRADFKWKNEDEYLDFVKLHGIK